MAKKDKNTEPLVQFHEFLIREFDNTPVNFDKFKSTMQDEQKVEQLHGFLKERYDDIPRSLTVFKQNLGLKKKMSQEDFRTKVMGQSVAPKEAWDTPEDKVDTDGQRDQQEDQREHPWVASGAVKQLDQELAKEDVKDDVNDALNEDGDLETQLTTAIQKEYQEKYPGALTPPEKINKFQNEVDSLKQSYTKLIKDNPVKKEQYQKQYEKEVDAIADDIGLYKSEDGDYTVNDIEKETYQETFKDKLNKVIQQRKEAEKDSWTKDALERLASSAERLYNVPANIFALSERLHNATVKGTKQLLNKYNLTDFEEVDNTDNNYWQEYAQYQNQAVEEMRAQSKRYDESITELVEKGDIAGATGKTALSVIEQIPQLLVFAGTGAAPQIGSRAGLGYVASGVGAEDYVNQIDEDVTEGTRIMNMLTKAGSEFAFEAATTLPILRNIRMNISRSGKNVVQDEMQKNVMNFFEKSAARLMKGTTPGLKESAGEVATELTQQWADAAAGQIEPREIGKNLGDVAITSYLIGDGMTRVSGLTGTRDRQAAKDYLRDVQSHIPQEMDMEAKQEALELMVKRDNLQSQMDKSAKGLQKGYQLQINKIDERLNQISEEQLGEEAFEQQETGQETEQKTKQEEVQLTETEKGEPAYRIGNTQYDTRDSFLEAIEEQKGKATTEEIEVQNDENTAKRATEILREGIEDTEVQLGEEEKATASQARILKSEPENTFKRSIQLEGKGIGEVTIEKGENEWSVKRVDIEEGQQQKGFGRQTYRELNRQAQQQGAVLRSDRADKINDNAKRLWDSLVKSGEAKQLDDGRYEMLSEGEIKQPETEKRDPVREKYMELEKRLSETQEGENVSDIGREFAQIQDQLSQKDRQNFITRLKDKQNKYVQRQQELGEEVEKSEALNFGMKTTSEIEQDAASSELVRPENTAEQNKATKDFRQQQPMARTEKNSFIEFEVNNKKLAHWHRKYLTSRGYIPKEVFNQWIKTQGEVKVYMERVDEMRGKFNKALKETYGKTKLGTPKVSQPQLEKLNEALASLGTVQEFKAPEGTQLKLQLEKRPTRQEVLKKVPEKLREPLVEMRNQIDALSQEMIREGLVEGDLAAKINDNLGYYLTRTYKIHNDGKWKLENIPEEIKNRAINTIRKEFPELTQDQVEGRLESLLIKNEMPLQTLNTSKKLGAKDLGILKKRILEDQSIRDLLGEYKDPLYNYSTSVAKMADLISRHKFLSWVREQGLKGDNPFLYETETKGFSTPIAAEGSVTMAPLNGLYTSKELAEAFETFNQSEPLPSLMRGYMMVNSAVKYGKTILSPQTHARNFVANYMFHVANGRMPFSVSEGPMKQMVRMLSNKKSDEFRQFYEEALRRGVAAESTWAGEVHDNIKESSKHLENFDKHHDNLYKKIKDKSLRSVEKAYRIEDESHKLYAFANEIARYREVYKKKNPDATNEEIEQMAMDRAAEIVRNTMPTYSLATSKLMMALRRSPIVGTFVSFPAEVIRNTANTAKIALEERRDPDTKSIGRKRFAGLMMAHAIPTMAAIGMRSLAGLDADDMEDIRKFLPPWSENSDILILKDKGRGVYTYIDVGYSDPFNFTKQVVNAALRGDSVDDAVVDAVKEFSEPFIGRELLAGKINDVVNNKKGDTEDKVYNEALPPGDKAWEMIKYLWDGIEPGGLSSAERIHKSFKDYEGYYGKNYDPVNEISALLTGFRVSDVNMKTSFYFKMKQIGDEFASAREIYWDKKGRKGISKEEKEKAYRQANQAAKETIQKANELYRAAGKHKVHYWELDDILEKTRVGNYKAGSDFQRMVRTGFYVPFDKY
jgi:hypothetical protein